MGANVSRVTFDWRYAEKSPGVWNLAQYDGIYNADLAQGIKPVFILAFAPQWTWDDPNQCTTTDCRYAPGSTHLDAWRDVVTKLVTRYPQLAGLEIWNEPNLSSFWNGTIDPAYYTQLVIQAHNAVVAAGSSVPVVAGALSNWMGADSATSMSYRTFLKGMYAAGIKGNMNALSIHPYPGDVDLWRIFKTLTETRDIRDANGDSSTPLWITEIGVSTTGTGANSFSENDQAVLLQKYYNELTAMSDVKAVFFHTLVDPSIFAPTDSETGFGELHVDLTPKPSYCKVAALRKTSYVCPSTVAPVTDLTTQQLRWNAQDYVQAAADAARSWYRTHGTYLGLTTSALHSINPSLSATAADGLATPGPTADPSRIGVWVWGTAPSENLLLCNTSQADRSYCIETQPNNPWVYGSAVGSVNTAAGAITNGATSSW